MTTEWIILADYAEFTSGKLYLMGGGWDQVTINHPGGVHNFGIGAAFRVDRNESDDPHDVLLFIRSSESSEPLVEVQARLEVGGNQGPESGSSQLAQLAMNLSVEFKTPGRYELVATIDGVEDRRFPFTVLLGKVNVG